jgi:hypothetical protein
VPQDVLDIYDSDVEAIFGVLGRLQDRARYRRHNYNDFDREIREAFAEIGFTVEVNWHEFSREGQVQEGAMPEVTVTGRTDPSHVFDKDRQVHEVTHNVLGLPEEDAGVIKADRETLRNFMEGNGHGHGHSH